MSTIIVSAGNFKDVCSGDRVVDILIWFGYDAGFLYVLVKWMARNSVVWWILLFCVDWREGTWRYKFRSGVFVLT